MDVHIRGTRPHAINRRQIPRHSARNDRSGRSAQMVAHVGEQARRKAAADAIGQAMMTLFWKRRAATTKRNVPMAKSARASIHRC